MPVRDLFFETKSLQGHSHWTRSNITVRVQFDDNLFSSSCPSSNFFGEVGNPGRMRLSVIFYLLKVLPVLAMDSALGLFLIGAAVLVWKLSCD